MRCAPSSTTMQTSLASFKLYIDNKDVDGLTKYYYDELLELNDHLLHQDRLAGSLQNIMLDEVKSILLYKGVIAIQHGIDLSIEATEPIEGLGVSSAIVCQILGILLDNAIEAAVETDEKQLRIAVVKNQGSKSFIVKNSWKRQEIPLDKLFELGFTTKEKGSGIGLSRVRGYTESIKRLYLETVLADESFTQILTVKDG